MSGTLEANSMLCYTVEVMNALRHCYINIARQFADAR